MLSLFPSPSNLRCSPQIFGLKTSTGVPSSLPKRLRFRPTVAAAAAAAAERSSSSCLCPPRPASSSCGSLYEVLGIPVGATVTEIKSAYRRLARICHPDVAGDDRKEISAGNFMEIHAAYSTLSDPEKRADYDRKLFRRLRPYGSFAGISSYPAAMSGFGGYGGRSWETDQCW